MKLFYIIIATCYVLQKEITVYVNKDGTVKDLLEEATEHIEFTDTTKQLRYVCIYMCVSMYVYVCVYLCSYVCMYVCMYVYILFIGIKCYAI